MRDRRRSIQQLILYRVIQGLFGGGLVATSQAALRDTFPRHLLGASQAVFALGAIVGPSVGPTVGGWLTDNFSWNWVFFINLVPGIFAAIVVLTMMRNPSDPKPIPIDAHRPRVAGDRAWARCSTFSTKVSATTGFPIP